MHLLAGTDAGVEFSYPGFSLHDELAWMVRAGLTPLEALQSATIGPARFLGVADLVLLRDNPLEQIGATRSIEAVILRGGVLDRAALDSVLRAVAASATE